MTGQPPNRIGIDASGVLAAARHLGAAWLSPGRRAVLWSFLDQLILNGFGFATGIATGRLVGIAEFGKFTIVMIFATLASVIHEVIVAAPMMTLAGRRQRSRSYFAAVFLSGSAGAILFSVLAAALLAAYYVLRGEPLSPGLAAATGVFVAVQCIQLIQRRILFIAGKGRLAAALDLGRYVLFVVFMGVLLPAGARFDAELVLWGLALSGVVAVVASVPMMGIAGARLRWRIVVAAARQHWQIGRWLVAVAPVGYAQDQLLWMMAGTVLGDAAIGGFRATLYLFGPILILMRAMENIIPVRAAEALAAHGLFGLKSYLLRVAIPLGTLNGALFLGAALPGGMWLALLFGPAYGEYAAVLQIMAVATALSLVRDYLIQYFRAIRSTNAIFYSFFSSFVLSVVLIFPLVKAFGVEGLAICTAASQLASLTYLAVAASRHYGTYKRSIDARRVVRVTP